MRNKDIGRHEIPWPAVEDEFLKHHLPGASAAVVALRNAVAGLNSSVNRDLVRVVSVTGETGAGKNHLARVVAGHRNWLIERSRSGLGPDSRLSSYLSRYAEISLPALPDSLVESELFGYKKGAFTGADRERAGLLSGNVDDILLDEIGDASATVQAKLLGVIESRRFRKLGADLDDLQETSARLIVATHRDLGALVERGQFREDLYWRVMEVAIEVPPLRKQPDNVLPLIDHHIAELSTLGMYDIEPGKGLRALPQLSPTEREWATTYGWPGNIRQLRTSLVRWLAVDGAVPLSEVVLSTEPAVLRFRRSSSTDDFAGETLRSRLDAALRDEEPLAETLGDFVRDAQRAVEKEIVAWYDAASPTASQIRHLFPGMKHTSVVNKISQWRTQ